MKPSDHDAEQPCPSDDKVIEVKETDPLISKGSSGRGYWSGGFGFIDWFEDLNHHFGYKLLVLLFACQHVVKGFVLGLVFTATPYLYKTYKIPAPQAQVYQGVTRVPWAMKPIIGFTSDIFPIRGYNKAPYMLVATVLGSIGLLYAGIFPKSAVPPGLLVLCLFVCSLQQSTCDLLTEAKYAEKIRACPTKGPNILTYVWFGMQVLGLISTLISGPLLKYSGPKIALTIGGALTVIVIFPVVMGYLEEERMTGEGLIETRNALFKQREVCFLCLLMFSSSIALTVVGIVFKSAVTHAVVAIVIGIAILFSFSVVLSPVIAKFNAFVLIQSSLALTYSGASFYFYTDTPEQYPEGPHFSEVFFTSVMQSISSVCSLIGIFMYQRYFCTWRYRNLWIMTNFIFSGLCAIDILMFARVNKRIGIPDHLLVLGLTVFEQIVYQWQWMPQVVILSYLCPKGMEATMYALLAGCANLGQTISMNCGALLLSKLGVTPTGSPNESDKFENLWVAATIGTVLPMTAILVLIRLVPDAGQNAKLIADNERSATAGSLWKRWTKPE